MFLLDTTKREVLIFHNFLQSMEKANRLSKTAKLC